ncbi:hypothetical protein CBOM_04775 [Ceraceosorus bombacis]|uniref:Uncharacterized protein n=1 Tax=Ceraceosorus bombacis TaxID=401625 RepID=A0A0P1BNK7_9BASI|nr:hypothetical protein CBOM_04775 [Ceraceosorus bombacis]
MLERPAGVLRGDKIWLFDGQYVSANPMDRLHQSEIFRILLVSFVSMAFWEHVITLGEEFERWKQIKRGQFRFINWAFMASRYTVIVVCAVAIAFVFAPVDSDMGCQALLTTIMTCCTLNYAAMCVILGIRIIALHQGQLRVAVPYGIIALTTVAIYASSVPYFGALLVPRSDLELDPYGLRCANLTVNVVARARGFLAAAALDVVAAVLAYWGVAKSILPAPKDSGLPDYRGHFM